MNKSLLCVIVCFLIFVPVFLSAQVAAELETILESPVISCAQAARFVFASQGITHQVAFDTAMERGWLPHNAAPDDPITLGSLSFLIMQAFDIKGGMMYAIVPGPRYAFRTMVSRSLIQGAADPAMTVSGERFLHILGNVLSTVGG